MLNVTLSGAATISAGANGTNTLTISGSETDINATLASLTYQGTANYNGADTLVVVSTDAAGTPLSDTDNVGITVNAVNDAPVLDLDANDNSGYSGANYGATFTEGLGPVRIADLDAIITDVDNSTLNSMTIVITNILDGALESLDADVSGTSITKAYNTSTGTLSLIGNDTIANYYQVLRSVVYDNSSLDPSTTARTIQVAAVGPGPSPTGASNVAFSTISVVAVDVPPPPPIDPGSGIEPEPTPEPEPEPTPEPDPVSEPEPKPESSIDPLVTEEESASAPSGASESSDQAEGPVVRVESKPVEVVPTLLDDVSQLLTQIEDEALGVIESIDFSLPKELGEGLVTRLQAMNNDLVRAFQEESAQKKFVVQTTKSATLALSAGFLAWLLRGGTLLASLATTLPAWRSFDPLPVVSGSKKKREDQKSEAEREAEAEQKEIKGLDDIFEDRGTSGPVR